MHKRALFVILSLSLLLFSLNFGVRLTTAQDTPAESTAEPQVPTEIPTEVPTEIPTEIPTEALTEVPTEMPTQAPTEVPTETPTEVPTETPTEVPTETPSEVPPEATQEPLPEATLEPTEPALPLTPPVFTLAEDALLSVVAGETLAFQVVAADDEGGVRVTIVTDTTAGIVNFQANPPMEAEPPYNTVVFVTYTAPAEFSGTDNFTLVAIDPSGGQAELALTITVTLPVPTEESVVPTPNLMGEPVERIIKYNPAASEESITAMLRSLGAVELDRLPSIGALRVMIPETLGTMQAAATAVSSDFQAQSAGIQAIEQNIEYHITGYTPNDPYLSNQWGLDDTYVHSTFGTGAWDMNSRRGSGIIVAVIDTGVDLQHPEFAGKLVAGWDFVNDDNNPDDDNNHGTHVAGVIAARTNNNVGIAGIAYNARVMPIKVCDYTGGCGTWEIAAGIVYAVDNRANVINMSLGGPNIQQTIEAAVQFAIASDVVVVASAGNGAAPGVYSYPASYPGVISVAAHQSDGGSAGDLYGYHTNDRITVSAPGVNIFSTVPIEYGSYQGGWNGTSMATPHVSGIVALIMSANIARTPQQVKEALICSAQDAGTAGYDTSFGWGVVQADWAMNWRDNSANCKVTQPNDNFEDASVLRVPTTSAIIQPIHTRSVTTYASDPTICGYTPQQTLWYKLVAPRSAVYQFSTQGSSYDTVLGVYQGMPGEFTQIACNDDLGPNLQSVASIGLTARQTYYIAVGSLSGTINDGVLHFDARYALPVATRSTRPLQENNAYISYGGSWNSMTYRGASGNRVMETYDNNATAVVTFQGNTLQLSRTTGPTREVWKSGLTGLYSPQFPTGQR
ncbi:MAG: S8 family serine peptidase [Anaerolineaceae bacterium]|nr:S8 family serine peptidase [Anaerolineaceae bacterium]